MQNELIYQYIVQLLKILTHTFSSVPHKNPIVPNTDFKILILSEKATKAVDCVVIKLAIVLQPTGECEYPHAVPLPIRELAFELLPLASLQCIEVLEDLLRNAYIWFELVIMLDPSALVPVQSPLSLVDQSAIGKEPLAISGPLVLLELPLVDLARLEGQSAESVEFPILFLANVLHPVVVDLLDSVENKSIKILTLEDLFEIGLELLLFEHLEPEIHPGPYAGGGGQGRVGVGSV